MLVKMSFISSGQAEGQFDCYWREVFPSKVVAAEAQLSQENKQRQMPEIIVWFFFLGLSRLALYTSVRNKRFKQCILQRI